MSARSFDLHGSPCPPGPVVVSVPHAGRDYPLALRTALRVPLAAALVLEDRHVDAVALAARGAETMLVQRTARAWIDLNRDEGERDPKVDEGADPKALPQPSPKLRAGLGLVPRRVAGAGELWRRRFSGDEIAARIVADHRPYHAALAAALAAARARFGVAVLLDLHSMPPLGAGAPRVVIGDRFGATAHARFVAAAEAAVAGSGIAVGLNSPYAGGHIVARHGAPADGIHAIQLELDRSLYLDRALAEPGPGLSATAGIVRRVLAALADAALPAALAAE